MIDAFLLKKFNKHLKQGDTHNFEYHLKEMKELLIDDFFEDEATFVNKINVLRNNHSVVKLTLSSLHSGPASKKSLTNLIKDNTTIKKFCIMQHIPESLFRSLMIAMQTNNSITKLSIIEISRDVEFLESLSDMLAKNTNITYLNLSKNSLNRRDALLLGNIFSNNNLRLKGLNLSHVGLSDDTLKIILDGLKKQPSLEELDLRFNDIKFAGAFTLFNFLLKHNALKKLNLNRNPIGPRGIEAILHGLCNQTQLENLSMNSCIDEDRAFDVRYLILLFNTISSLKKVAMDARSLTTNFFNSSHRLNQHECIESLTLSITYTATMNSLNSLSKFINLKKLKLVWDGDKSHGWYSVVVSLKELALIDLELSIIELNPEGIQALAKLIDKNCLTRLKTIFQFNHSIVDFSLDVFSASIKNNTSLKILSLTIYDIKNEQVEEILSGLHHHRSITYLSLPICRHNKGVGVFFANMLNHNTTLKILDIGLMEQEHFNDMLNLIIKAARYPCQLQVLEFWNTCSFDGKIFKKLLVGSSLLKIGKYPIPCLKNEINKNFFGLGFLFREYLEENNFILMKDIVKKIAQFISHSAEHVSEFLMGYEHAVRLEQKPIKRQIFNYVCRIKSNLRHIKQIKVEIENFIQKSLTAEGPFMLSFYKKSIEEFKKESEPVKQENSILESELKSILPIDESIQTYLPSLSKKRVRE